MINDETKGRRSQMGNPIHQLTTITNPQVKCIGHVLREPSSKKTPFAKETKLAEKRQELIDRDKKDREIESFIRSREAANVKCYIAHMESLVEKKYDEMKEAELKEKGAKLKELFHNEHKGYSQECQDLPRLMHDRKVTECLEKHEQMMKKKKQADEKIAEEKFDQLFRENSVELRTYYSQQLEKDAAEKQMIQIQKNQIEKTLEKEQNKGVKSPMEDTRMSRQEIMRIQMKEKESESKKKYFDELRQQIRNNEMMAEERKRSKANEIKEFEELQESRKREYEQWLEKNRQHKIKLHDEMYSEMVRSIENKKKEIETQKSLDILYVQAAANRGIDEVKANAISKAKLKEEIDNFLTWDSNYKNSKKQQEAVIEEVTIKQQKEYEEVRKKREQMELERNIRLIKEVKEFQRRQIDDKIYEREKLKHDQDICQNKVESLNLLGTNKKRADNEKLDHIKTLKVQIDEKNCSKISESLEDSELISKNKMTRDKEIEKVNEYMKTPTSQLIQEFTDRIKKKHVDY